MLCPKCRQPLDEGEESYVCCAGASLQWHCTQCAKVSEGFAFPYGRCPHCAGALEPLEGRALDGDDAALAGIRGAFEIELGGEAFYRRAAADAGDARMRELFARFAAMERDHMRTLAQRYHVAVPERSAAIDADLAAMLTGIESRPADAENLFQIAIALERRAVAFFERRAEAADAASSERQLYRELAAEEREHAELLATERARWRTGRAGLLGMR